MTERTRRRSPLFVSLRAWWRWLTTSPTAFLDLRSPALHDFEARLNAPGYLARMHKHATQATQTPAPDNTALTFLNGNGKGGTTDDRR
jgi:hypothetical protein